MNEIVPEAIRHPAIRTEMVEANGLNFEVDKCGNSDKLAICLHGFPEHSFSWRYQLPFLAELGYEAWAPNLRGYGGSDKPQGGQKRSCSDCARLGCGDCLAICNAASQSVEPPDYL
mgnify:CR=1 FL=1